MVTCEYVYVLLIGNRQYREENDPTNTTNSNTCKLVISFKI